MWPRTVEVMLGCWLMISPFVFRFGAGETFLWANSLAAGSVMAAISLVACRPSLERVRFLNLLLGAYLFVVAVLAPGPLPPPGPYQNYIVVALLLLIVAVIPTQSTRPPLAWQAFYENRQTDR